MENRKVINERKGTEEPFNAQRIIDKINVFSNGLSIDIEEIASKVLTGLGTVPSLTTNEINKQIINVARSKIMDHKDYDKVAVRFTLNELYKSKQKLTKGDGISQPVMYASDKFFSDEYKLFVTANKDALNTIIKQSRDELYSYAGLSKLIQSYLLKVDGKVIETPQELLMRVAIVVTDYDLDKVAAEYNNLSLQHYTYASPTLFNAGTKTQQLASCFLVAIKDDSIDGIFDTLKECAKLSKCAGGLGIHVSNVRGRGTSIATTGGSSNGLTPFLKIFNETAKSVDQGGGKRKGSFAVYIEPWHSDIEEFLELKKPAGAEELRARDLFLALWVPDLFMERVENDEMWSLMCPHQCPNLQDKYGKDFKALYEKYEAEGKYVKQVPARKIIQMMIQSSVEGGVPYVVFKDTVNRASLHKHLGTVKSSNLCAEIVQHSDKDHTAVCTLASINLTNHVKYEKGKPYIDWELLNRSCTYLVSGLDTVIDSNVYPTEAARRGAIRTRDIGIGVQGLQDVFYMFKYKWGSPEALKLDEEIFKNIQKFTRDATVVLGKVKGNFPTFENSPLQVEKGYTHSRNCHVTTVMPTASTSVILGNYDGIAPNQGNVYKTQDLSGENTRVNPYLIQDLKDLGLWSSKMMNKIILGNGSIQGIPEIPTDLKELYLTAYELKQKDLLNHSAIRQPYIDQAQSFNLHGKDLSFQKIFSMYMYAWKQGLKTGQYYLRTKSAVNAVKMTTVQEDCESCSA